MSLLKLLVLFSSAITGGVLAFKVHKPSKVQFVLTFGGAYLFVITIVHVLPELYSYVYSHNGFDGASATAISMLLLAGFFFQKVLEHFSSGIEHGHFHSHLHLNPVSVVGALCVHAFVDGLILIETGDHHDHHLHHSHGTHDLFIGIILHKIPAAFVMVSVLKSTGVSKKFIWTTLALFALSSPAGQVLGTIVVASLDHQVEWVHFLTAFVAGNFLHISTTIFLETNSDHSINWKKMLAVLAGACLALITFILV